MASSKFNKTQAALQSAFGTAIAATAMTIQLPWRGTYEDRRHRHVSEWDAGTWTPTTAVAQVATEVGATFEGTAFFEALPVLLSSGWEAVAPSGSYIHTYTVSPGAVAVPKPLTILAGTVGTNVGGTGPAVRLYDLYLKTLSLSANINDKAVMLSAEMFGTTYDDNSGAGYLFDTGITFPATMEVINGIKGVIRYQDATTTGGDFATMTDFDCAIIDWTLDIDTGIEPLWCLTDETTTFSGLKYTQPSCTFTPIVRTSATNYAAVKAKADARTYQEVQLLIAGTSSRELKVNMTGLWDVVPSAHDEQDGEVVMKPTFRCQTSHLQTSQAHWLAMVVTSTNNWT